MAFTRVSLSADAPLPSDDDILVLLASTRNPLFNDTSYSQLANYTKRFKQVHINVAGMIQRHTEMMEHMLGGAEPNPKKAEKNAQSTETQHTNKVLAAFVYEGFELKSLGHWKPKYDFRDTPASDLTGRIEDLVTKLQRKLAKLGMPPLETINGLYNPNTDAIKQAAKSDKEISSWVDELRRLNGIVIRQETRQITADQTHYEENNDGDQAIHLLDYIVKRQRENKDNATRVEVMQWEAVAGKLPHPDYERAKLSNEVLGCQEEGKAANVQFNKLVDSVTENRLKKFYKDDLSLVKASLNRAKKFVRDYLLEEIPYFQMLIDVAIEKFIKNGRKGTIRLGYPMSGGRDIFEFMVELNKAKFAEYPGAFVFEDISELMKDNRFEVSQDNAKVVEPELKELPPENDEFVLLPLAAVVRSADSAHGPSAGGSRSQSTFHLPAKTSRHRGALFKPRFNSDEVPPADWRNLTKPREEAERKVRAPAVEVDKIKMLI